MTRRPLTALAAMFLATLLTTAALAVPVTFEVRMAHQIDLGAFDPATDFVDLAGDFNGWGADLTPLADPDGDTIYTVTVDGFSPGQTIEFKFRINGQWDGSEEFPGGGPNRVYTVQPAGNAILVWYGDVVPQEPDPAELSWWNDTVFYEIFVRSFHDSDGDGIGDLQGIIQKLDHLNDGDPTTGDDLGIGGIWLMPINDSPSYHGYDTTDYRAIDPDYGTLADLQQLLDACHARGIRVIVDYVMNHCSTQHPWFQAAAAGDPAWRDWFRWSPFDPGQTGPWGQDVWHWHASGWYYGLFWGGMPDLNYDHPPVRQEMFETAAWWLQDVGVDGFRLDAVLYIHEDGDQLQNTAQTFQFWQDFGAHVRAVAPDALTVGEAWTNTATVVQYVTEGRLDLAFEFDLAGAILGAVNDADTGWLGAKAAQVHGQYPYLQVATFLTNHDQDRVMTVLGEDAGRARVATGILMTLPGVPFVYYGEEIGMTGAGAHENIRTPMQWTGEPQAGFTTGTPWHPVNGDFAVKNVAAQDADPGSLLNWYRRLIAARNASPALRRGTHHALEGAPSPVLAFVRAFEQERLLVVANTAPQPLGGFGVTGTATSLPPGAFTLVDLLDPADQREVTVTADHALAGLSIGGHDVAVYRFSSATGVDDGGNGALPAAGLHLAPAHPNPFNPVTTLRYTLPAAGEVRLTIHDLAGRQVAVLRDGMQEAGRHAVRWRGVDADGRPLGAGVYVARLQAGEQVASVKLTLVK
jgi:glycosidase